MVSVLDKKLGRDLWRMKGQALAIAVVISLGVLMLVMMDGLVNSLEQTKRAYYERYRLADVFVTAKRAPNHLLKDIAGANCVIRHSRISYLHNSRLERYRSYEPVARVSRQFAKNPAVCPCGTLSQNYPEN